MHIILRSLPALFRNIILYFDLPRLCINVIQLQNPVALHIKRGKASACEASTMKLQLRYYLLIAGYITALSACAQTITPPTGLTATPFERHITLRWEPVASTSLTGYKIYKSDDGVNYSFLKQIGKQAYSFDWTGDEGIGVTRSYKVTAIAGPINESDQSEPASATTFEMNDEQLRDMEQEAAFRYFWDFAHPVSGLARERNTSGDIVTTGGSGFGIMAIVAGVERGWITREAAVNRLIQIISFLQFADRFHGAFPHWMDGTNGNVIPFSQYDNGGDLVETAFLIQGLLAAREYFDAGTPLETALRDGITDIWEDVEWDWYRRNNSGVLYWHWSPNYAWQMNFPLRGFNETHIVYILAIASPTHPVPASLYQSGWASSSSYVNNSIHFGYPVYTGPFGGGPMFFAHYSYLGFDPRYKKDAFCNYFIRNRNHALIQQAYCAANPENHAGYSGDCWGLTASDNPWGYLAHDIYPTNDNGTIAPTAALASYPYATQPAKAALRHFYRNIGEKLWGDYGFQDAFNGDQNWFSNTYLAIDQGPIVVMMENERSGLFWELFMKNSEIQPALDGIGFVVDSTVVSGVTDLEINGFDIQIYPNPAPKNAIANLEIPVIQSATLSADLFDINGRLVQHIFQNKNFSTGIYNQLFKTEQLAPGIYCIRVTDASGRAVQRKFVVGL